jgi:hypothetical protein
MSRSVIDAPAKRISCEEVIMRRIVLILVGAAIASCSTTPPPPAMRSAEAQNQFQRLIAGKVAGPPVSCMPSSRTNDMTVIDESTVAFRQGGGRVFVAHMQGECSNLGAPSYALLTKQPASLSLCHGDIAQVIDTHNGMTVGSCVFDSFTPYTGPNG